MSCDVDMFHHLRDRRSLIDSRWRAQYVNSMINTVPFYDQSINYSINQSINQTVLSTHQSMLENLSFERLLTGHEGCINRLAFNQSGSLLASGSDDCTVSIYQWLIDRDQSINQPISVQTGHEA